MIIKYFKFKINAIVRSIYWFYRLNQVSFGRNNNLSFPIKVEGKGNASFQDNNSIEKNAFLGVGLGGVLEMASNSKIETNAHIAIGNDYSLKIGDNFKIGTHARLFVKKDWVFGTNVSIETYCSIFSREADRNGKLIIGNNCNIGDFTIMDVVDDIIIGNDVAIGPNCTLYTHDHIYTDRDKPAWKGGLVSSPIVIEDGAWVGSNVTILPGVTIGKRTVVAAGSVVTKSLEPESIYGGVPAKLIKTI
nr:acyltransferase [uncultured Psychroserpens sp.]